MYSLIYKFINKILLALASAERALLLMASITEVESRLKLWLFLLEFEAVEMVGG